MDRAPGILTGEKRGFYSKGISTTAKLPGVAALTAATTLSA